MISVSVCVQYASHVLWKDIGQSLAMFPKIPICSLSNVLKVPVFTLFEETTYNWLIVVSGRQHFNLKKGLHTSTLRTLDVKMKSTPWYKNQCAFCIFVCIFYICLFCACLFGFFCQCVYVCVCVLFWTIEPSNCNPRCLYYESSHLGISIMYSFSSWSKEKLQPSLLNYS